MAGILFREMQRIQEKMDNDFRNFHEVPKILPKTLPGNIELFNEPISGNVKRSNEALAVKIPELKRMNLGLHSELLKEMNDSVQETSYFDKAELPAQAKVENACAKFDNGPLSASLPKGNFTIRK